MKKLMVGCLMAAGLVNTAYAADKELRISLWVPPVSSTHLDVH